MTATRSNGMIHGLRPGSVDTREPIREVEVENRVKQRDADRAARRHNPAYGRLNLDEWTESLIHSNKLLLPPGGRPRKKR